MLATTDTSAIVVGICFYYDHLNKQGEFSFLEMVLIRRCVNGTN